MGRLGKAAVRTTEEPKTPGVLECAPAPALSEP